MTAIEEIVAPHLTGTPPLRMLVEAGHDGTGRVRVEGELDVAEVELFQRVWAWASVAFPTVHLDLAGLSFVDVAAARALRSAMTSARRCGADVDDPSPAVSRTIARVIELDGRSDPGGEDPSDLPPHIGAWLVLERLAAIGMAIRSVERRLDDEGQRAMLRSARAELLVAGAESRRLLPRSVP